MRRGVTGKLFDQPRLADAGLAREQHQAAAPLAGCLQTLLQHLELALAPNEWRGAWHDLLLSRPDEKNPPRIILPTASAGRPPSRPSPDCGRRKEQDAA